MSHILLSPEWLFGYNVVFKLVIAFITAAVSYYALKMYRLSGRRRSKLFSIAFGFFSLSYLAPALFSLNSFSGPFNFTVYNLIGAYFHTFLFILGTATLTYMTFDIESPRIYGLLILITLASFVLSGMNFYLGYAIISIMLFYVLFDYLLEFIEKKSPKSLMISIAFGFLFISHIHFLLAVNHELFFAIGNILELVAYLLVLINLIMVFSK